MEKIDLRELNKMTKTFRAAHRALKRLKDDEGFEVSFCGSYRHSGSAIPIVDETAWRRFLVSSLDSEVVKLRKRLNEMGIDPLDIDGRKTKKAALKVAKSG